MILPNFVCVGVEKAGTTAIYQLLNNHPDVFLGHYKEHFFFNHKWSKGVQWYKNQFSQHNGQKWVGDITPSYFRNLESYKRIKSVLGQDVKVLLVLRNPIYRAISHYFHSLLRQETELNFYDIVEHQDQQQFKYYFTQYFNVVDRVTKNFKPKNILILIYENDIEPDLGIGLSKIYQFLDIDPFDFPQGRYNVSYFPRYVYTGDKPRYLEWKRNGYQIPQNTLIWTTGKKSYDKIWMNPKPEFVNQSLVKYAQWTQYISARMCQKLFNEIFLEDCQRLENKFNLNISSWYSNFKAVEYEQAPPPNQFLVHSEPESEMLIETLPIPQTITSSIESSAQQKHLGAEDGGVSPTPEKKKTIFKENMNRQSELRLESQKISQLEQSSSKLEKIKLKLEHFQKRLQEIYSELGYSAKTLSTSLEQNKTEFPLVQPGKVGRGQVFNSDGTLYSQLWVDQPGAHIKIDRWLNARKITTKEADSLHFFVEHGYLVLDLEIPESLYDEIQQTVDYLWKNRPNDLLVAIGGNRSQPFSELPDESSRGLGVRFLDLHSHSESVKQLYLHPSLHRYCQLIYNQQPVATQTLYFEYGSNQPLHRDPFYVVTNPPSNVLASWIALEDIKADSGPLNYVPGSHKLPYYKIPKTGNIILHDSRVSQKEKDQAYKHMYEMMDKHQLQQKPFLAKKGQAFLWHASLIHGGSSVENPSQTRKSLVTHYDVFANHPSQSQRVHSSSKKPITVTTQKLIEKNGWIGFDNPLKKY